MWWALGALAYVVVALAVSGIDWASLSGLAGVPLGRESLRERWRVYGEPWYLILGYPIAVVLIVAGGAPFRLWRWLRPRDVEAGKVGKAYRAADGSPTAAMASPVASTSAATPCQRPAGRDPGAAGYRAPELPVKQDASK